MISIITPCLNSADVLATCLDSVAEQQVTVEHMIVDGGSTDATADTIRQRGAPVKPLPEPVKGMYAAMNAGIRAAQGEIIGLLNADDFYPSPHVLEQVAKVLEDEGIDGCYGDLCYVDAAQPGRIVRYWRAGEYSPGSMRHGWMPPHPTFFVRRGVFERAGLYREDLGTAADYEWMLRVLMKHEIRVAYVPKVLVHMRTGGASNASLGARLEANRMDRRAWRVNGLKPYPWTLLAKPLRKLPQWWRRPRSHNAQNLL